MRMKHTEPRSIWATVKKRRLLASAALLIALLLLAFCSSSEKTFKRHAEFGRSCEDVLKISDDAKAKCVTLYFGTTRKPKGVKSRGDDDGFDIIGGFGNTFDNRLHFGRAQVSMPYLVSDLYPEGRKRGVVDHAAGAPPEGRAQTERFVAITTISKTEERRSFAENLREAVGENNKSILLFIHGFNVDFDSAVVRAAQMAVDIGFNENAPPEESYYELGQPVLFSWPNGGVPFSYVDDRRLAKKSATHLNAFLTLLTEETGAASLNIVVHSMGNRVLVNAIADFARDHAQSADADVTIRIIHAAADVDQGVYDKAMDAVERTAFKADYTVYASREDTALQASTRVNALTSLFHDRSGRLGEIGENGIYVRKSVTSIDATGFATDLFGHGYFSDAGNVINDIACVFHGVDLSRRALVPRRKGPMPYYEMDSSKYAICLPGDLKRFATDAADYAAAHRQAVARAKEAGVYDAMSSQLSSLAGDSIWTIPCAAEDAGSAPCSAAPGGEPETGPQPPPDREAAAEPMTVTVYFDFDRADLTRDAVKQLNAVTDAAAGKTIEHILIAGHADSAGGEQFNQRLSLLRADAVRELLMSNGVARDIIFIRGLGETDPAEKTGDGERNPLNRRALIFVTFAAG